MIEPQIKANPAAMTPLQLAYVGDSVYSLMVRTHLMQADRKLHHVHGDAATLVSATAQARALERISPYLTPEEIDLVRRGRNAHARHQAPRSATTADYGASTALEVLFGYQYLGGHHDRLRILFEIIFAARPEDVHA